MKNLTRIALPSLLVTLAVAQAAFAAPPAPQCGGEKTEAPKPAPPPPSAR